MPARLIVKLQPKLLHEHGVWADTGPAVHAHLLTALGEVDPGLADRLHRPPPATGGPASQRPPAGGRAGRGRAPAAPRFRPYALTPILHERDPTEGTAWRFEVGVLDDELTAIFSTALEVARLVRSGHSSFLVERVDVLGLGYPELVARSAAASSWRLRLVTPMAFRSPGGPGPRLTLPLPPADRVFGSLARRFTQFAGPGLLHRATTTVIDHHLALAEFSLRTRRHLTKGPAVYEVGCVGEARYDAVAAARLPTAALQAVTTLVNFAAFAGLGDQTTKGMGHVLPLPDRQKTSTLR